MASPTGTARIPRQHEFSVLGAINNFGQGVQLVAENNPDVNVGELVVELTKQLQEHPSSNRPHYLVWVLGAAQVSLIFAAGIFYQRVNNLEDRIKTIAPMDAVTQQLRDLSDSQNKMQNDLERLQQRLDRFLDNRTGH